MTLWRIGTKVPINVYDGDRPVCQAQTAADARLIVAAVNEHLERIAPEPGNISSEQLKRSLNSLQLESRGTFYEPSSHSAHCIHCGQTYDQHKASPHGECQDAVILHERLREAVYKLHMSQNEALTEALEMWLEEAGKG